MEQITVRLISKRGLCDQIITGFLMLEERLGRKRFPLRFERVNGHPDASTPLVEVQIGDALLYYDTEDCYWATPHMKNLLDSCTAYFKRSYSEDENQKRFTEDQHAKIHPLGFYYSARYPMGLSLRALQIEGRKLPRSLSRVTPAELEAPPSGNAEPRVMFCTRLWDPDEARDKYKEDRILVSETRIRLIRALREQFGDLFTGGLSDSPYARKLAPDLILPPKTTSRRNYLRQMQNTDIVIASTGLHGSVGGKLGEYVAASRAIVTEPLLYEPTGSFTEGVHYLSFETVDQCLEQVERLRKDPEKIRNMQEENQRYWQEYLRPDILIENSLKTAGIHP